MAVLTDPLIRAVLRDESFTRGLGDVEARMLVDWVAEWTDLFGGAARTGPEAMSLVGRLVRRAKAIGKFVRLWQFEATRGAAVQLAGVERFGWPLPTQRRIDPADLMQTILRWENDHRAG